jgi:hypothetical protein
MTTPVYSVTSLSLTFLESQPPKLAIHVGGKTGTPNWTGFALMHRVYITPPADGVYEADVVGVPPGGMTIEVVSPFSFSEIWGHIPADLKGFRVYSATDSVTTMLE